MPQRTKISIRRQGRLEDRLRQPEDVAVEQIESVRTSAYISR